MIGDEVQFAGDALPQRRLPALVGAGGCHSASAERDVAAAVLPLRQPVGAVGDVLLQQRGGLDGQLVAHYVVGAGGLQVSGQARLRGHESGVSESGVDAPGQRRRIEGRLGRHAGHHPCHLLPEPARQEHELDVGADAFAVGQSQCHFAPHRGAGNDHLVGREDVVTLAGQLGQQQIPQVFVAVGKVEVEHGTVGLSWMLAAMVGWSRLITRARVSPEGRQRGQSTISYDTARSGNTLVLNRDLTPLPYVAPACPVLPE